MKKIAEFLKNPFYVKLVFIIVGLLTSVPFIYQQIEGGIKIILIWSAATLIYIAIKNWKYLVKLEYILLILFVVSYIGTILVNFGKNTIDEIMLLAYTGIFLFLLTYIDKTKSKEEVKREICVIFFTIIIITFLYSLICLVMFCFSIEGVFLYRDIEFPYGMWEGRLWGLYNPNTGAVLSYISLISTFLLGKYGLNINSIYRKVLNVNVVVQICYFVLAQSRGGLYAFLTYVVVYCFFIVKNNESSKKLKKRILRRCIVAYCALSVIMFSDDIILEGLSYIPECIYVVTHPDTSWEKQNLKREEKEDSIESQTTGRSDFWKLGIEIYKDNLIVGVGQRSISEEMEKTFSKEWYDASKGGGLHCVYITILASCGTIGSVMIFTFFAVICVKGLKFLLNKTHSKFEKCVMNFIPAMLIGDLVESRIVLTTGFLAIFFWIMMGYTMYYFENRESIGGE